MSDFTPFNALAGGALIGAAAVLLMGSVGRIAGISGILSGALLGAADGRLWRTAFAVGLVLAWPLVALVTGTAPPFVSDATSTLSVLAGLLVGFGTQLGSGCTSGHGVCGIARQSPRSLVATAVFMTSGIASVALARTAADAFATALS